MDIRLPRTYLLAVIALAAWSPSLAPGADNQTEPPLPAKSPSNSLAMIVMDPLAAELACPCVKGYAQRNYAKLAEFLAKRIGRPVEVFFAETLPAATEKKSNGKADIVVGKFSVVRNGEKNLKLKLDHVSSLTGQDGNTHQTGLFVVPADDAALEVADLKDYRIIYGPSDCDEKHLAALKFVRQSGLTTPDKLETCESCSDGAVRILQIKADGGKAATVISSYAQPLLEGCGTINKGDLRIIGETEPVPFVAAFLNQNLTPDLHDRISKALLDVGSDPHLCKSLETKRGFIPPPAKDRQVSLESGEAPEFTSDTLPDRNSDQRIPVEEWTGWRGARRDGRVPWLPAEINPKTHELWRVPLAGQGVGGVAATRKYVLVSDRELGDTMDLFRCLRSDNGDEVWTLSYPTEGNLDFGNSPRATPLIHGDKVFLSGAYGNLHAVHLETGEILWQIQMKDEFHVTTRLHWGFCGSPLIVNDFLIINPGGERGALAALNPESGEIVWRSDAGAPSYGSMTLALFEGKPQIVGHDFNTLGGWDPDSGKRLWSLKPPHENDFNVPTPLQIGKRLLVTTENNFTRLYDFRADGTIEPQPVAVNEPLAPDSHSPVVVGNRLFGIWDDLYCLDLNDNLKTLWVGAHSAFASYASLIASPDRLLATGMAGELILIDAAANEFRILGEARLFEDQRGVYSHPALVGSRLYVRGMDAIVCIDLSRM